ncbi:MAG: NlpC/P60 family protein [Blastocatellia bacterium]
MVTREQLIAAARLRLGTPYQHQGRDGFGLDCIGLLLVVAHELGLSDFDFLEYSTRPDGVTFQRLCGAHMDEIPVTEARAGDVLLLRFGRLPQHAGILTSASNAECFKCGVRRAECGVQITDSAFPTPHSALCTPHLTMIHALNRYGVIEHRLDAAWLSRIVAAYRVRGLED